MNDKIPHPFFKTPLLPYAEDGYATKIQWLFNCLVFDEKVLLGVLNPKPLKECTIKEIFEAVYYCYKEGDKLHVYPFDKKDKPYIVKCEIKKPDK